jgi:hypothetical protein
MTKIKELEHWAEQQEDAIAVIRRNATFFRQACLREHDGKELVNAEAVVGLSEKLAKQLDQSVTLVRAEIKALKKIN